MAIEQERVKGLQAVAGEGMVWINLERPTEKELEYLKQLYPFHPLDIEDCVSKRQLSKIDEYEDYIFIILHFPRFHKELRYSVPSQVAIFVGRNYVVTVHNGELKPISTLFQRCQSDESQREKYLGQDPGYFLYCLIDNLVEYCFPMLEKIKGNLDEIEDLVFNDKVDAAKHVAELRRDIVHQRRIISPLRRVLSDIEVKIRRFSKNDLSAYFGDVSDHLNRIWETLEECKEVIEIYKDVDFILSTDRTNRILTILTVLTVIVLPFAVISGIYGMNLPLPFIGGPSLANFVLLLSLMILFAGGLLFFFRYRRWV